MTCQLQGDSYKDFVKEDKGIDWSKKCLYKGIGRMDLHPDDELICPACGANNKMEESEVCKECL